MCVWLCACVCVCVFGVVQHQANWAEIRYFQSFSLSRFRQNTQWKSPDALKDISLHVCTRVCVCLCERACGCVCVKESKREGEREREPTFQVGSIAGLIGEKWKDGYYCSRAACSVTRTHTNSHTHTL